MICREHKIKHPQSGVFYFVLPPGVEPGAPVPQTDILSIKLRELIFIQLLNESDDITKIFGK